MNFYSNNLFSVFLLLFVCFEAYFINLIIYLMVIFLFQNPNLIHFQVHLHLLKHYCNSIYSLVVFILKNFYVLCLLLFDFVDLRIEWDLLQINFVHFYLQLLLFSFFIILAQPILLLFFISLIQLLVLC